MMENTTQHALRFAAATGLVAYGQQRGYPVKNKAAPLERASPHVRTMFVTREILSKKPVSLYLRPGGFTLDVYTFVSDWEIKSYKRYQKN